MESLGKSLLLAGLVLAAVGALLWLLGPKLGAGGLLPGDLSFKRGQFTFFFPVVTCLVLSLLLTLLLRLFNR